MRRYTIWVAGISIVVAGGTFLRFFLGAPNIIEFENATGAEIRNVSFQARDNEGDMLASSELSCLKPEGQLRNRIGCPYAYVYVTFWFNGTRYAKETGILRFRGKGVWRISATPSGDIATSFLSGARKTISDDL